MANPQINPNDPRVRELARGLFGDRADVMLGLAERMRESQPISPTPAPRDAGKFVRQLAALYCEHSQRGAAAQELIQGIIRDALHLVNLIAEANPEESRP